VELTVIIEVLGDVNPAISMTLCIFQNDKFPMVIWIDELVDRFTSWLI